MIRTTMITASLFIFLSLGSAGFGRQSMDLKATPAGASNDESSHYVSSTKAGGDWLRMTRQGLVGREYHVSRNDRGLQAPNRANDLRFYFDETGIGVVDRLATDGSELLRLTLTGLDRLPEPGAGEPGSGIQGFGGPESGKPVAEFNLLETATIHSTGNRVEIRREGLTEWFINDPRGLEHGFTIPARPAGNGELRLTMKVSAAEAALDGDRIVLTASSGRKLEYGGLYVKDAAGNPVSAALEVPDSGTIEILVQDSDTLYPLTIDPLLTSTPDTLVESDQELALLGYSVSTAGDVNGDGYADVIVGANSYDNGQGPEGAAFVHHGGPSGISTVAAAMVVCNQHYSHFGEAVSGAGDVNGDGFADVIVGAYHYDDPQPDAGAAFVYHGSATGISTMAAAMVSSSYPYAYMGHGVSGAGDVNGDGFADVIIGAGSYGSGETEEGVAFIYHGSASGIASLPATGLEHDQAYAYMGHSVSGAGDVNGDGFADVIVGASHFDNGNTDEGVALVYHGNSDGRPVIARQLRGNGDDTPVQPWGISHDADDFQVRMVATHPDGLGRVKLQVECCGPGANFGDPSCETFTSPSWEGTTYGSRTLTVTIPGLTVNSLYRWRARALHAHENVTKPGITPPPNPSHGPWRRLAGLYFEADIRIMETGGSGGTTSADLACVPFSGTVPFVTNMTVTLINNYSGQSRRIAARINLTTGDGQSFSNWRSGWTNLTAGDSYVKSWPQTIPALGAVIGSNVFHLVAEDVTPSPYNQPPHPPSGDTDTSTCTVTGIAP